MPSPDRDAKTEGTHPGAWEMSGGVELGSNLMIGGEQYSPAR
jgi:hypothetical protein